MNPAAGGDGGGARPRQTGEAVLTGVKEEDWANNWKQYFKPFPVGEKLYIRPSWEHDEPEAGRHGYSSLSIESSWGSRDDSARRALSVNWRCHAWQEGA